MSQPGSPDVMPVSQDVPPASPDVVPGSPDILEELETEVMNMLDEAEGETDAQPPSMFEDEIFGKDESSAGGPQATQETSAMPSDAFEDGKEESATLDPEVANALEEELFGAADAAGSEDGSADVSETELFGPEAEETTATCTTIPPGVNSSSTLEAPPTAAKADGHESCDPTDPVVQARRKEEAERDEKMSRWTKDPNGNYLHKWKADYAARGGGGRAQCRDSDCLERMDQGGVRAIEKGCLRIGRRVLMDQGDGEATVSFMWYHARCIFNTFLRARKSTRIIESEFDIEGFPLLNHEDQEMIRRLIAKTEKPSTARFGTGESIPNQTPAKRPNDGANRPESAAEKKRRTDPNKVEVKPGDRVWTFFRCLPKDGPGVAPGVAGVTVKSEKAELAMIREDPVGANIIVQFESEEHEKERIELFQSKRGKRIRGWLRYPRLFEGRKQRVPVTWLQLKRNPPALCGCKVQQWGHSCDCGISCGRGSAVKVWGVGDTAA